MLGERHCNGLIRQSILQLEEESLVSILFLGFENEIKYGQRLWDQRIRLSRISISNKKEIMQVLHNQEHGLGMGLVQKQWHLGMRQLLRRIKMLSRLLLSGISMSSKGGGMRPSNMRVFGNEVATLTISSCPSNSPRTSVSK